MVYARVASGLSILGLLVQLNGKKVYCIKSSAPTV